MPSANFFPGDVIKLRKGHRAWLWQDPTGATNEAEDVSESDRLMIVSVVGRVTMALLRSVVGYIDLNNFKKVPGCRR